MELGRNFGAFFKLFLAHVPSIEHKSNAILLWFNFDGDRRDGTRTEEK